MKDKRGTPAESHHFARGRGRDAMYNGCDESALNVYIMYIMVTLKQERGDRSKFQIGPADTFAAFPVGDLSFVW